MATTSRKVIIVALIGNFLIALFKLFAGIVSQSSAIMAEAFRSFSDSLNQAFLLIGLKVSSRPADEKHPFGYGKEQFFWSLIVSMLIFGVAGTLSFYEGINKISHPETLHDLEWSYLALAIGVILDGFALIVALRHARAEMKKIGEKSFINFMINMKDPSLKTVIIEDSLALLDLFIAFVSIQLTVYYNNSIYDGIGSVLIGLTLMFFGLVLVAENKELLIGEAIDKKTRKKIIKMIELMPQVNQVIALRSMYLGAEQVLVNLDINFKDGLTTEEIEDVVDKIESKVKEILPEVKYCFIEAEEDKSLPAKKQYIKVPPNSSKVDN